MRRAKVFSGLFVLLGLLACQSNEDQVPEYEPAERLAEFSSLLVRSHNALEALSRNEDFWPAAASRRWMDSSANDPDGWALQLDFGKGMQWADGSWVRGTLNLTGKHWPVKAQDTLHMNWTSADSFAVKASDEWIQAIGWVQYSPQPFLKSRLDWVGSMRYGLHSVQVQAESHWELVPENAISPHWSDAHWLTAQVEMNYVQALSGMPIRWTAGVRKAERSKHCLEQILAGNWTASPLLQAQDSTRVEHDPFRDRRCDAAIRVASAQKEWLLDAW